MPRTYSIVLPPGEGALSSELTMSLPLGRPDRLSLQELSGTVLQRPWGQSEEVHINVGSEIEDGNSVQQ